MAAVLQYLNEHDIRHKRTAAAIADHLHGAAKGSDHTLKDWIKLGHVRKEAVDHGDAVVVLIRSGLLLHYVCAAVVSRVAVCKGVALPPSPAGAPIALKLELMRPINILI